MTPDDAALNQMWFHFIYQLGKVQLANQYVDTLRTGIMMTCFFQVVQSSYSRVLWALGFIYTNHSFTTISALSN